VNCFAFFSQTPKQRNVPLFFPCGTSDFCFYFLFCCLTSTCNQKGAMNFIDRLGFFFFPRRCAGCGAAVPPENTLCVRCAADPAMSLLDFFCLHCGAALPDCDCADKLPVYTCYDYASRAGAYFRAFKFGGKHVYAHEIARVMSSRVAPSLAHMPSGKVLVCAVPMTRDAVRVRGYNQSDVLARLVAKNCGVRFVPNLLVKTRRTLPQRTLNARERSENLQDAFAVRAGRNLSAYAVLCVDDVVTTGATLSACTAALRDAGAMRVACLTFLRAKPHV
jgi:ComF family protein